MSTGEADGPSTANEERWKRFIAATTGQPAWPELVRAAALFERPGDALDVGACAGRDTIHLLSRGWHVTAVDSSPSAVEALRRIPAESLTVVTATAQDFVPSTYDLVNAQFSLPFIRRSHLDAAVARLRDSVRPGASCARRSSDSATSGINPEPSSRSAVVRTSRGSSQGWETIELDEAEEDGKTADGSPKHWHVFHVTARRPVVNRLNDR